MKRNLMAMILALCLLGTSLAGAEGLLPSLVDTIGKPMPSLGEALDRYPDEEISGADGENIEVFQGVTETDFNTFSVYLREKGATLADYQTAGNSFSASIQMEGKMISFTYDTQTLKAIVTYPKGTYDEWLDYAKTQWEAALQLLSTGKTDDALILVLSIPAYSGFKPVVVYFAAHPKFAAIVAAAHEAKISQFRKEGGYVTFGHYPQTTSGTDRTPIEWIVLDYDQTSNRALLISRYGLDARDFHEYARVTWETSSLRRWLNGEFLNKAFTKREQKAILLTMVDNSQKQGNSEWNTSGGKDTQDRIFLLSYAEAHKYFEVTSEDSNNVISRVTPTAYALQAKAWTNNKYMTTDGAAAGWWWLRSPGDHDHDTAYVDVDGSFGYPYVVCGFGCVRPVLWIDLGSDNF